MSWRILIRERFSNVSNNLSGRIESCCVTLLSKADRKVVERTVTVFPRDPVVTVRNLQPVASATEASGGMLLIMVETRELGVSMRYTDMVVDRSERRSSGIWQSGSFISSAFFLA